MAGVIYGTVKNSSGDFLTNAVVSCPGMTVSNNSGTYSMSFVNAGTYAMTASASGYTPKTSNVTVTVNQIKEKNFVLDAA